MRRLPNERLQRSARNRGSRDIQHRCARPLNLFVGPPISAAIGLVTCISIIDRFRLTAR